MSYILQALKKSEQERELAAQHVLVSEFSNTQNQLNKTGFAAGDALASSSDDPKRERMIPLSVYVWLGGFVITLLAISGYVQMQLGASSNSEPAAINNVEVTQAMKADLPIKEALVLKEAPSVSDIRVQEVQVQEMQVQEQEPLEQEAQQKPQIIRPTISAEQASDKLQSMIPNIEVSSHIYSTLPERRSIVVNGQRLVETDFINPQVQIKEITHQGMVIDVDGSPLKIDRSRGWSR